MAKQTKTVTFRQGMAYLGRSVSYMGNMQVRFWMGELLLGLELLSAYISPLLSASLIGILETGSAEEGWQKLMLLFAAFLLVTPLSMLGDYWSKLSVIEAERNLSIALFSRVQDMPLKDLEQYEKGDLVTRIVTDAKSAVAALRGYTLTALIKFVLYTVVSLAILLWESPLYAAAGLTMSVTACWISFVFSPKARRVEHQAKQMVAGLASPLMEAVANAPVIRVFSLGRKLQGRFGEKCDAVAEKRILFRTMNGVIEAFIYLFSYCVKPATFLMGIYLVWRGDMSIVSVVYLSGVTGILAEGLQNFSTFIQHVQSSFVALDRVFWMLDGEKPEKRTGGTGAAVASGRMEAVSSCGGNSHIHMEGIRFSYRDGAELLHGIDLDIPKRQKAAIVGSSGCGKSTLAKLVIGLYEPSQGKLSIDAGCGTKPASEQASDSEDGRVNGQRPRNVFRPGAEVQQDCAPAIAYVSQACDIFRGSVKENIGYGKRNATQEEIEHAAKRAGCDAFIKNLPQGYETMVDENGTNLSGGQKQRIAIARSLLSDAPILVLDEVTSAVDASTEEQILEGLFAEVKEKTVLMITHKVSAARRMERILVMENGLITEDGSHEELLAKKGWYYWAYLEQGGA